MGPRGPGNGLRPGEGPPGRSLRANWDPTGWGRYPPGGPGAPQSEGQGPAAPSEGQIVQIWYTDFQTPPHPLDFNEFCQKRNPVSTIFGAAGDGSESLSLPQAKFRPSGGGVQLVTPD